METGIHALTAGYALDALDPDERRAYEAHLEECEQCREELEGFWQAAEALAVAASGPEPSPELRGRILAAARAERQVVVPLVPRRRRLVPVLAAAAAAAAVVALGLGLWATRISDELDEARATLAVLSDPGARSIALRTGQGRLVVAPDGEAALVVGGLGPAPTGKAYALWIVEGSTPTPAGLFAGREGADVVRLEGTVEPGDVVAVTIEDAGGVDVPTTKPIVASDPV